MSDTGKKPVVVLGAGPAGLGAAYRLSRSGVPVILLEKEPRVGGMGATIKRGDYAADYGPHTFHMKDTQVTRLFEKLSGPNLNKVVRNAKIWIHGKTLPFPLRPQDAIAKLNPFLSSRIMFDYVVQIIKNKMPGADPSSAKSFEEWGVSQFGYSLYRLAFGNYSEKMWGMPGGELSVKLARQKLVGLNLFNLILSMLGLLEEKRADAMGLTKKNLYDAYPEFGIGTFFEAMARDIEGMGGKIILNAQLKSIEEENGKISSVNYVADGENTLVNCSSLVTTIPLPSIVQYLPESYSMAKKAAANLRYRSLNVVHLVLDMEHFSEAHWTYLLDPRLISNRLSEQKHLSANSCPPGKTMVTLDITCNKGDYMWKANDSFLIGLAMNDLQIMGLHPRAIVDAFVLKASDVYPVYNIGFEIDLETILGRFRSCPNLFSIGRHGLLLNNDMHDSIEMGFFASQMIMDNKTSSEWYDTVAVYVRERLEGMVKDPITFDVKDEDK